CAWTAAGFSRRRVVLGPGSLRSFPTRRSSDVGVKVTVTPGMTFPKLSLTTAASAVGKAVLTVVLWGVPAVGVRLAGAPGLLVRANVAEGLVPPEAVAVTV